MSELGGRIGKSSRNHFSLRIRGERADSILRRGFFFFWGGGGGGGGVFFFFGGGGEERGRFRGPGLEIQSLVDFFSQSGLWADCCTGLLATNMLS